MKRVLSDNRTSSALVYLPVRISNPDTHTSVLVNAKIADYFYFGFLGDLSQRVIDALDLPPGRIMEGVDDENDLVKFRLNSVIISFHGHDVTGEVNTNSSREDTVLFPNYVSCLPDSLDLSKYEGTAQMRQVFLSHSHQDKRFVRPLARALRQRGIGVWVDEAEIKVGESLIAKLREGIDEVDFVVAIISPASVGSEWVQKEIDIAMNEEIKKNRIKVLPVLKGDCELPGFLEGKLFADFRKSHQRKKALKKLVDSILTL